MARDVEGGVPARLALAASAHASAPALFPRPVAAVLRGDRGRADHRRRGRAVPGAGSRRMNVAAGRAADAGAGAGRGSCTRSRARGGVAAPGSSRRTWRWPRRSSTSEDGDPQRRVEELPRADGAELDRDRGHRSSARSRPARRDGDRGGGAALQDSGGRRRGPITVSTTTADGVRRGREARCSGSTCGWIAAGRCWRRRCLRAAERPRCPNERGARRRRSATRSTARRSSWPPSRMAPPGDRAPADAGPDARPDARRSSSIGLTSASSRWRSCSR